MAYRTTDTAVIAVLTPGKEYDVENNPSLAPAMDAANSLVNRVVATRRGSILSSEDRELIERYLAAHFYLCSDKAYKSKSAGGSSGSFAQGGGKGLELTDHGMTALRIDYTGMLNSVDKYARPKIVSL